MECFARLFRQDAIADVDLVIRSLGASDDAAPDPKRARGGTSAAAADTAAWDQLQLAALPAHKIILFNSEYFEAQARHWQQSSQAPSNTSKKRRGRASSSKPGGRPALHLTIDSAEQLPATEAAIAAMYGVPDALSNLEQQQLVHAVLIADILGVATAAQQAVQALITAAQSLQGLSAAAMDALAMLPAWPACLLQLLPTIIKHAPCRKVSSTDLAQIKAADTGSRTQQLLLAVFGDLDAVWAGTLLVEMLLALPLPAMQLLLSSEQLRVTSEDTVMFTAQQYVAANDKGQQQTATAALAPLVRAPQLLSYALSGILMLQDLSKHLLGGYGLQLSRLASLRRVAEPNTQEFNAQITWIYSAPASWRLGPRQIRPLADGVRLEWRLPVEQLKQACRDSFAQKRIKEVRATGRNPPVGGQGWRASLTCMGLSGGVALTVLMTPEGPQQKGIFFRCKYTMMCNARTLHREIQQLVGPYSTLSACLDRTAGLPLMAGDGWDEAAWAAAGLPASGDLLLQLHVHSIE